VFRVFVAGLLMTFRLVLFETLMQGLQKNTEHKHSHFAGTQASKHFGL
jgi:hypothetical protein